MTPPSVYPSAPLTHPDIVSADGAVKRCSTCNTDKPYSAFTPNPRYYDGYYGICKECRNTYMRQYRAKYPERFARYTRKYYIRDSEKIKAESRAYRARNGPAIYKRRKDKYATTHAYVTKGEFAAMLGVQEGLCFYCRIPLMGQRIEVDHKIPVSKGGSHQKSNLCLACIPCNRAKKDKTPEEFVRYRQWIGLS